MKHHPWLYIVMPTLAGLPGCLIPVQPKPKPVASSVASAPSDGRKSTAEQQPPKNAPAHRDMADSSSVKQLKVNGDNIEAHELWRDLRGELSTKAERLTPADYRAYVEQRAARLITDKIAERLLFQRASSRLDKIINRKIDAYVDGEIRRIVASDYSGSEHRYKKHLESQGRTLDDMRENLRREIIITTYLEQEVRPKIAEPTRAELLAAFRAGADPFHRPMRRRMSLIEVRVLDFLPMDVSNPTRKQFDHARTEALSRIRTIQAQVNSGDAFVDLAQRYSNGLHANEGGAWGWVTKGSVRERFEPVIEVLYQLNVGEVSHIVETADAFFLVRCDEIDPGIRPDFEAAQPQLTERLFGAAYNRRVVVLVAELRSKAGIDPAVLQRFHAAVVAAALHQTTEGRKSNSE